MVAQFWNFAGTVTRPDYRDYIGKMWNTCGSIHTQELETQGVFNINYIFHGDDKNN